MLWKHRRISPRFKRLVTWFFGLVLAVSTMAPFAHAGVVFDPASGSYFELVEIPQGGRVVWLHARQAAEQRFHKGIRGRLAVIKNQETHKFIRDNLNIHGRVWIGLRYFCSSRKVVWITGETLATDSDFQPWHRRWARTHIRCAGLGYMPIYYTDENASLAWQASGPGKGFELYLVEYPAQ